MVHVIILYLEFVSSISKVSLILYIFNKNQTNHTNPY